MRVNGNRNQVDSDEPGVLVIGLRTSTAGVLPAVDCLGSFAVELDGSCFAGGGAQIAFPMREAQPACSVVGVV
jgi:hypothetical protein